MSQNKLAIPETTPTISIPPPPDISNAGDGCQNTATNTQTYYPHSPIYHSHGHPDDIALPSEDEDYSSDDGGIEPSYSTASDEIRLIRGLISAAPQVSWAEEVARDLGEAVCKFRPFTSITDQGNVRLPSGLPTKMEVPDSLVDYLRGSISLTTLKRGSQSVEMIDISTGKRKSSAKVQHHAGSSRTTAQAVKSSTKTTAHAVIAERSTSFHDRTITERIQQTTVTAENTPLPLKGNKRRETERFIEQLISVGKLREQNLSSEDLDEIRNSVVLTATFKGAVLHCRSKSQRLADLNARAEAKKARKGGSGDSSSAASSL